LAQSYELTNRAEEDLIELAVHLGQFGVDIGDKMIDKLKSVFQLLSENKLFGRSRDELAPDLRSYVVSPNCGVLYHEARWYCCHPSTSRASQY
jgi:plasmid stabilization system protein ParE